MPTIPTADSLRTLNLAYRHLQRLFRVYMPELFRRSESITTDSSGYLNLPTYVIEVEDIRNSSNNKLSRIDLEEKFHGTGYYPEGMDISGGANDGKRRLLVRENGSAKASTAYTVMYLREYTDLASTAGTPYPFTQKAWLDMLTTLQAYFWLAEQGDERKKEKEEQWKVFERHVQLAGFEGLDDEPEYGATSHADAGDRRSYPILNVSSS